MDDTLDTLVRRAASLRSAAVAEAGAAVDPLALRRAMGRFPTGVAVATTVDLDGAPVGITVNSVSSVSLAPPLVLWSIDLRASSLEAFRGSGVFALNLLPLGAADLCRRFSSRAPDRFAGVAHRRGPLGLPLLVGMLAHLCCRLWARYPGGDHEILVGEVLHAQYHEGEPLVFHQGQLARLDPGAG